MSWTTGLLSSFGNFDFVLCIYGALSCSLWEAEVRYVKEFKKIVIGWSLDVVRYLESRTTV